MAKKEKEIWQEYTNDSSIKANTPNQVLSEAERQQGGMDAAMSQKIRGC